jgi:hypothetical protein
MKKLIGAFCDYVNMHKKRYYLADALKQIKVNNTQTLQMIRRKVPVDRKGEKI